MRILFSLSLLVMSLGASLPFFVAKVNAQVICAPTFERSYGGNCPGEDNMEAALPTSDGGYLVGGHQGYITVSPNRFDIEMIKLGRCGNIEWAKLYDGGTTESALDIAQTRDAGYVTIGQRGNSPMTDILLSRMDSMGNLQWAKTLDHRTYDFALEIEITEDNGYIIAGLKLDNTYGESDGYLVKLDSLGTVEWANNYNLHSYTDIHSLKVVPGVGYLAAGPSFDTTDYSSTASGFLFLVDTAGNLIWSVAVPVATTFMDCIPVSDGGFVMVGHYNASSTAASEYSYLITKFDRDGILLWSKRIAGGDHLLQNWSRIIEEPDGGLTMLGGIAPDSSDTSTRFLLLKMNATGTVISAHRFANMLVEVHPIDMYRCSDGGYLIGGTSSFSNGRCNDMVLIKTDNDAKTGCEHAPVIITYDTAITALPGPSSTPVVFTVANYVMSPVIFPATGAVLCAYPAATAFPDTTICAGASVQLGATGGTRYAWSPSASLNDSTLQNPIATPLGTTTYRVVAGDGCCRFDTAYVTVVINPLPPVNVGNDTTLPAGASLILSAATPGASYLWQSGSPHPAFEVTVPGMYWVRVTLGACVGTDTIVVNYLPAQCSPSFQKLYGERCPENESLSAAIPTMDGGYLGVGNRRTFVYDSILQQVVKDDDLLLTKLNGCGAVEWTKSYNNDRHEMLRRVQQTADGGYIIAAEKYINNTYSDILLVKTDGLGNILWNKMIGTPFFDGTWSIQIAEDGGFVIAGYITVVHPAETDAVVIKTDGMGNVSWIKSYRRHFQNALFNLKLAPGVGYIAAGYTADLTGGYGIIMLLDYSGNIVWSHTTIEDLTLNDCVPTNDGGFAALGSFDESNIAVSPPYMVLKFSAGGNLLWTKILDPESDGLWSQPNMIEAHDGGLMIGSAVAPGFASFKLLLTTLDPAGTHLWSKIYSYRDAMMYPSLELRLCHDGGSLLGAAAFIDTVGESRCDEWFLVKTDVNGSTGCEQPYTFAIRDTIIPVFPGPVATAIPLPETNPTFTFINKMMPDTIICGTFPSLTAGASADTTICAGNSIQLSATGGVYYTWSPGAALNDSTLQNPTATPLLTTTYRVIVRDSCCAFDTAFVTITVNPAPQVNLGNDTTLCRGTLLLNAMDGEATYSWQDGSTDSSFLAAAAGVYWVDVTRDGCTVRDSITVSYAVFQIDLGNDTTLSPGQTLLLNAATAGATYQWQDGSSGPTFLVDSAGIYWVEVTVSGCTAWDTIVVNFNIPCTITVSASITAILCAGDNNGAIKLIPFGGEEPYSTLWNTNDTALTISDLAAGTYFVTVTDAHGCVYDTSITLAQVSIFEIEALANNASCDEAANGSVTVVIESGTTLPYSYLWSTDDTIATVSGIASGIYTVTVTDMLGCVRWDTAEVGAGHLSLEIEVVDATCPAAADGAATVNVTGGTEPYTYEWSNGVNQIINPNLRTGTYYVTVTDHEACRGTDTAIVAIDSNGVDCDTLVIYDVFSPNGDGTNDMWIIDGLDVYAENELQIYNRWGNIVFEASPYLNNWDGRSTKNEPLPSAVYYFILKLHDTTGAVHSGSITLIR